MGPLLEYVQPPVELRLFFDGPGIFGTSSHLPMVFSTLSHPLSTLFLLSAPSLPSRVGSPSCVEDVPDMGCLESVTRRLGIVYPDYVI